MNTNNQENLIIEHLEEFKNKQDFLNSFYLFKRLSGKSFIGTYMYFKSKNIKKNINHNYFIKNIIEDLKKAKGNFTTILSNSFSLSKEFNNTYDLNLNNFQTYQNFYNDSNIGNLEKNFLKMKMGKDLTGVYDFILNNINNKLEFKVLKIYLILYLFIYKLDLNDFCEVLFIILNYIPKDKDIFNKDDLNEFLKDFKNVYYSREYLKKFYYLDKLHLLKYFFTGRGILGVKKYIKIRRLKNKFKNKKGFNKELEYELNKTENFFYKKGDKLFLNTNFGLID